MNIPHITSPVLLNRVIQQVQDGLSSKLKWLDYAFGRSYKVEESIDNDTTRKFPAVYTTDGEYQSVLPDDTLGNFSFFEIYDPTNIADNLATIRLNVKGAIIFWVRLDTIYPDSTALYHEEVKLEVIKALKNMCLKNGRILVNSIYEDPASIYKGYNTSQIDGQYLLYPYYGFRIEVELNITELCA